jgi:hypothetical protein
MAGKVWLGLTRSLPAQKVFAGMKNGTRLDEYRVTLHVRRGAGSAAVRIVMVRFHARSRVVAIVADPT